MGAILPHSFHGRLLLGYSRNIEIRRSCLVSSRDGSMITKSNSNSLPPNDHKNDRVPEIFMGRYLFYMLLDEQFMMFGIEISLVAWACLPAEKV